MDATIATVTVLAGSAIFLVGAGIGVHRVFTEPDRAKKVRMLEDQIVRWRVAQPLDAIGPLVAGAGVGLLAAEVGPGSLRIWIALSCLLLLPGALPPPPGHPTVPLLHPPARGEPGLAVMPAATPARRGR